MSKTSIRWVIKFGGSLSQSASLATWLKTLAELPSVIVVPGGGLFADAVRMAQNSHGFDDLLAHDLAIRAMALYGRMLIGMEPRLNPALTLTELIPRKQANSPCLWLPDPKDPCLQNLKATWDVTSDTIAAQLALELEIPALLMVKSVDPGREDLSLKVAIDQGLVDPALEGIVRKRDLTLWIKGPNPEGLAKALEDPVSSLTRLIA